jgi:hypothetical protein
MNKEVYLTVLLAHSSEGHLQYYLCSLEADLADAAQDEGDGAEDLESVAASIDKECEAGVPQAPRGTAALTRRYPWCISARLSPLS